ncbi:MAG: hypothetical protein AAGG01_07245, partial [Planctomycetota bacterium]
WYLPRRPLGAGAPLGKASQGDALFVAPNPAFGATFTYHLAQGYKTAKELRADALKETGDGEAPAPPSFDEFRRESKEEPPSVVLTITDAAGSVVTRIHGPASKGIHRVTWNLRRPDTSAWQRSAVEDEWNDGSDRGALCPPGDYTVHFGTLRSGQYADLGIQRPFRVVPLGGGSLPGATPEESAAFQVEIAEVSRVMSATSAKLADALERVGAIRSVLRRTPALPAQLGTEARDLENRLKELQRRVDGDDLLENANEAGPMSLGSRMAIASMGTAYSTYGPTPNHLKALDIVSRGLEAVRQELLIIESSDIARLNAALDGARAPWTPGR